MGFRDDGGMSVNLCLRSSSVQSMSMIAHLISLKVWKISGILGHVRHSEGNVSALKPPCDSKVVTNSWRFFERCALHRQCLYHRDMPPLFVLLFFLSFK